MSIQSLIFSDPFARSHFAPASFCTPAIESGLLESLGLQSPISLNFLVSFISRYIVLERGSVALIYYIREQ